MLGPRFCRGGGGSWAQAPPGLSGDVLRPRRSSAAARNTLAAKNQGEIWFSWTPLCLGGLVAFIYQNASWKSVRKEAHSAPVSLPNSGISPQWKKADFFVLRANNGGRLPGGGNLCSFFPCRSCSSCCSNPFTHTQARLCKPRLPLLLAQYAGTDRETGKDAGLGVRAQLLVLSFNAERGKGLHLITVKCKTLP